MTRCQHARGDVFDAAHAQPRHDEVLEDEDARAHFGHAVQVSGECRGRCRSDTHDRQRHGHRRAACLPRRPPRGVPVPPSRRFPRWSGSCRTRPHASSRRAPPCRRREARGRSRAASGRPASRPSDGRRSRFRSARRRRTPSALPFSATIFAAATLSRTMPMSTPPRHQSRDVVELARRDADRVEDVGDAVAGEVIGLLERRYGDRPASARTSPAARRRCSSRS